MAETPGALAALVAALAGGCDEASNCAVVLQTIAEAETGLAQHVAETPEALQALVAAVAAGGTIAIRSAGVLETLAGSNPGLARLVAEAPGALSTLVAAAGGEAGACCSAALVNIPGADPALAQRVAEVPEALPALVAAVAAGGDSAAHCLAALGCIVSADPRLTHLVAELPGALPALVEAAAGDGDVASAAGHACAGRHQVLGGSRSGSGAHEVRPLRAQRRRGRGCAPAGVRMLQNSTLLRRRVPTPCLARPQGGVPRHRCHKGWQSGGLSCNNAFIPRGVWYFCCRRGCFPIFACLLGCWLVCFDPSNARHVGGQGTHSCRRAACRRLLCYDGHCGMHGRMSCVSCTGFDFDCKARALLSHPPTCFTCHLLPISSGYQIPDSYIPAASHR